MWNSWKNEQRFVKFYLKKSSSISFRHNQPSKSLRSRRKRPNFIGAQETFIDGPVSGISGLEFGVPESTSGSGTSSENTFGTSPSELSMTTTETTTTTTTTTSTDSECDRKTQGIFYLNQTQGPYKALFWVCDLIGSHLRAQIEECIGLKASMRPLISTILSEIFGQMSLTFHQKVFTRIFIGHWRIKIWGRVAL